jgi:intracellular sulfur oxidation DsrE/DsrF family protein
LDLAVGFLVICVSTQLAHGENKIALASRQASDIDHVILHISESDPRQFSAALRFVEYFLDQNPRPGSQIEVVANAGGLDLMRDGISPFKTEIVAIMRQHDNVHFIVCSTGIHNLRRRGIEAKFIGDVDTDETAVDPIVNRLQAGWTYIKVNDLPEI